MPITLNKKKELISDLEKSLKGMNSVVFVKFDKLRVADANILRRSLQVQEVGYKVTKKTLLKRVLEVRKIKGNLPEMPGQIAIAYGLDLITPAREIFNFKKSHKENIEIIGGIFEDKYLNSSEMMSIATIPSLQILRGMFVNLINSPIQRLIIGLDQIAKKESF